MAPKREIGAYSADLALVSNFFHDLWSRPISSLKRLQKAGVLAWAENGLQAVGRLQEAIQPQQAAVENFVQQKNWKQVNINASGLSGLWLSVGEVSRAVEAARQSVGLANRSGDLVEQFNQITMLANALHQAFPPPALSLHQGGEISSSVV